MNPEISVIICTHNPRMDFLNRVLGALRLQTLPVEQWELLIIDNASTISFQSSLDLSWQPNARFVTEMELGVTQARMRGISEARGSLIVFVDDDNVISIDYLSIAKKMANEWPQIGAWSGKVLPEFERPPNPELLPYLWRICIREISSDSWGNSGHFESMPWGAGMCLRMIVAKKYLNDTKADKFNTGFSRTGKNFLASGEDVVMAFKGLEMGYGTGVFQALQLTHLIPKHRVTEKYLLQLIEDTAAGNVFLTRIIQPHGQAESSGIDWLVKKYKFIRGSRIQRAIAAAEARGVLRGKKLLSHI